MVQPTFAGSKKTPSLLWVNNKQAGVERG